MFEFETMFPLNNMSSISVFFFYLNTFTTIYLLNKFMKKLLSLKIVIPFNQRLLLNFHR